MIAIAKKDISPLIKKGTILVKKKVRHPDHGLRFFGIMRGYDECLYIECTHWVMFEERTVKPPNYYTWRLIEANREWFKISKE